MPQGRLRGVAALVSLAAIVALFVFAFHAFTAGPNGSTGSPDTPTIPGSQWKAIPGLTNQSGLPTIAPSNPLVVYEAKLSPITLQRSDDDGRTWHKLPVPTDAPSFSNIEFFVSPLNAQRVFVEFQTSCPLAQTNNSPITAYSGAGGTCAADYFSTDGGMHWSRMQWPTHQIGNARLGEGFMLSPLQAQGTRLYAFLTVASADSAIQGDIGNTLVTSADGGSTWQFADQSIAAQGYCVSDFAPTPTGTTVFAIAEHLCSDVNVRMMNSGVSPQSGGANTKIWRSDDAGAHWTVVASDDEGANLHIGQNGAGQPILYDDGTLPPLNPPPAQATRVSLDGGKTWQLAPAGADGQFSPSGILGTLSDGSVVEAFADTKTHQDYQLFSWKPGDAAWHQLSDTFHGAAQSLLIISSGNGQATFWLVTNVSDRYNVQRFDLK